MLISKNCLTLLRLNDRYAMHKNGSSTTGSLKEHAILPIHTIELMSRHFRLSLGSMIPVEFGVGNP